MTDIKSWVELICAVTIPFSFLGVIWQRILHKKSLSARSIQFVAVVMLIPAIVILALEGAFKDSTVGTIVGGLIGYLLSGIGEYENQTAKANNDQLS